MKKEHYRSVILSDVHLGTRDSRAHEAVEFLKSCRCDKLILNGDIVDGWAIRNGGKWKASHTRFVRAVLKKMEKEGTEVIYLRGNHDDILERFLPIAFGKLTIEHEYILATDWGNYLIIHGDGFDSITTNHRFIASIGAIGYAFLLRINRLYNRWRSLRGKPYYSVSKDIKAGVKSAVSFIDHYEERLQRYVCKRNCVGIICGHIHTAADKILEDGTHYLNSGDWVESLTAIVEKQSGEFELIHYDDFLRRKQQASGARESLTIDQQSAIPITSGAIA